jgi:hypothetical protein
MMPTSMRESIALQRKTATEQSKLASQQRKIVGDLQELPERIAENFDAAMERNQAFMKEQNQKMESIVKSGKDLFIERDKSESAGNFMGSLLGTTLFLSKYSSGLDGALAAAALGATIGKVLGGFIYQPIYWVKDHVFSPIFNPIVNSLTTKCAPLCNSCKSRFKRKSAADAATEPPAPTSANIVNTTSENTTSQKLTSETATHSTLSGKTSNGVDSKHAEKAIGLTSIKIDSMSACSVTPTAISNAATVASNTNSASLDTIAILDDATSKDNPISLRTGSTSPSAPIASTPKMVVRPIAPPIHATTTATPISTTIPTNSAAVTTNPVVAGMTAASVEVTIASSPKRPPSPSARMTRSPSSTRAPSPTRSSSPAARKSSNARNNSNPTILPLATLHNMGGNNSAFSATAAASPKPLAAPTAVRPIIKRSSGSRISN